MSTSRVSRPAGPTTAQPKQSVSLPAIHQRTTTAAKLESIFKGIRPGQKLANAEVYLDKLHELRNQAAQDHDKLFNPKIAVTEPVKKARVALEQQIIALKKAIAAAQSANILPEASKQAASKGEFPWSGQLRDDKDTPLHWAVRNRDMQTALAIRYQMRLTRLAMLCQHYEGTVKNPEILAILKNPDVLAKLFPAIEKLHILNYQTLDAKGLQKHLSDPDLVKVFQDPNFRKILTDSHAVTALNGLDILMEIDSQGMSPIDEAQLQQDPEMTQILLFPQLFVDGELKKLFWGRINELRGRIAEMRQVNPDTLSNVCKAAYYGDIDQLEIETNLTAKDAKGLTPLHYAILGGQAKSISYLLDRSDIYVLTPQGRSYLDYAIASGHGGLVELFQNLNIPFRLGEPQEGFSYILASGILTQRLAARANARDPIAMGGKDQDLFGLNLNAIWAGTALFNWTFGVDAKNGWLARTSTGVEWLSHQWNHHAVGFPQVLKLLPTWAHKPAATTHQLIMNAAIYGPVLYPLANQVASWAGKDLSKIMENCGLGSVGTVAKVAWQVFSVARLVGATKPVVDRLPAYYHAYGSRPKPVMKALAWDAFNIGTQALMTDYSGIWEAKSRFFG